MIKTIKDFVSYWYFRYLLVTELYMVEKWERAMFHIVLLVFLLLLYVFNTTVILGLIRMMIGFAFQKDIEKIDQNLMTEHIGNV